MFKATLAGVATIALATIPMLAIGTVAHAAPVVIQVSDIDTLSAAGAQTFQQRADAAAKQFCRTATAGELGLRAKISCRQDVQTEISEKLAARNMTLTAARQFNTLAAR